MLKKKNLLIHALSLLGLCGGFVLYRFVLLDIHNLMSWSEVLFFVGLVSLAISFFLQGKAVPICTALAYSIGFVAGFLFQTDGVDPGGGSTNTLWIIWTAVFVCMIAASIIGELIWGSIKKHRK